MKESMVPVYLKAKSSHNRRNAHSAIAQGGLSTAQPVSKERL